MIGVLAIVPLMALAVSVLLASIRVFWHMGPTWGWHVTAITSLAALYSFIAFLPTLMGWAELVFAWVRCCDHPDSSVKVECRWVEYDKWTGVFEKWDDVEEHKKTTYFCPLPCVLIKISWNGEEP